MGRGPLGRQLDLKRPLASLRLRVINPSEHHGDGARGTVGAWHGLEALKQSRSAQVERVAFQASIGVPRLVS